MYRAQNGLHANLAETSAVLRINADLVDLDAANAEFPPFPAYTVPTGGVHTAEDVIKAIMAGADVTMLTSALLKYGIPYLTAVREDLTRWLDERGHTALAPLRGILSQRAVAEPAAFERANYMKVLRTYALRTLAW